MLAEFVRRTFTANPPGFTPPDDNGTLFSRVVCSPGFGASLFDVMFSSGLSSGFSLLVTFSVLSLVVLNVWW